MKFLIVVLFLLMPFNFVVLEDALEDCNIDVNNIASIRLSTSTETILLTETESIEDVLDTPIIRTLEQNEDGSFDIPDETYLIVVGVIEISELSIDLYPSFGVIYNEEENKYWMLVFVNNVTIRDNEGIICGMFQIFI